MENMKRKDLVKKARKEMKLTQVKLAQKMGVNQTSVSRWEDGETEFNNDRLFKLKREFEKIIDDYDKSQEFFQPFIDEILGVDSEDIKTTPKS